MEQSLDKIMKDFHTNGRTIEFAEPMDGIADLGVHASDGTSFTMGLQNPGLDLEMKIIRPPSKTPAHLPTSTVNLVRKQLFPVTHREPMTSVPMGRYQLPPPGYNLWPGNFIASVPQSAHTPFFVDISCSMSQMSLSDSPAPGPAYMGTPIGASGSRPIYGNRSTMKPSMIGRKLRLVNCGNRSPWDGLEPFVSGTHIVASSTPQDPLVSHEAPSVKSAETTENKTIEVTNAKSGRSYMNGSWDDDIVMANDSADSGIFSSGDMTPSPSSRSGSSALSTGESPLPSYASVLNTPNTSSYSDNGDSDCGEVLRPGSAPCTEKIIETPKSHHFEGLKAHSWVQKKSRHSESSVFSSDSKECAFCKTNGETPNLYRSHILKDEHGRTMCRVLQKYVCPLCGATGENAHTVKYCPKNKNPPPVSMMTTLKSMRSATGNVRLMSNTRRTRSSAAKQRGCAAGNRGTSVRGTTPAAGGDAGGRTILNKPQGIDIPSA